MLRPYQNEALEACRITKQNSKKLRGLIVLPTGAGKTVVLSKLPDTFNMQPHEKMLVLVHRDELVWQTREKLGKYNPGRQVGIEKAQFVSSTDDQLIVASVQTIGRNKLNKETGSFDFGDRIQKFRPDDFQYIVVDEAHHSLGDTYRSVLAYFGVLKDTTYDMPGKLLLGVTATPNRGDNMGLESIFDRMVYQKPLPEMIQEGWLCDIEAYRVDTTVDLSEVSISHGDFAVKQLEKTVNTPSRNQLIVDKYLELGKGQRAIGFTVDIQHSVDLADCFNRNGVRAFALSGKTPEQDRRKVLQLFREGFFRVLTSAGVLSEGFDDPAVTVGLMTRPTKSGLLYRQQIGRVLRPSPSPEELAAMVAAGKTPSYIKERAIVIDFCDLSDKHVLHTAPTLFGLNAKLNTKGKTVSEAAKEIEEIIEQKKLPLAASEVESFEKLKSVAQRVDLLGKIDVPPAVQKHTSFRWMQAGPGTYSLSLPDYAVLRVSENALGGWTTTRSVKGIAKVLGSHEQLGEAIRFADQQVPADAKILLNGQSAWRRKPVTDAQVNLLWKLDRETRNLVGNNFHGFSKMIRETCQTCGAASDRINQLSARKN
jgi:ATP-dependent helicase IRC3